MTREEFSQVKRNIESYKGKYVKFTAINHYTDKEEIHYGIILNAGKYCFTIGWCGMSRLAHYENVELKDKKY